MRHSIDDLRRTIDRSNPNQARILAAIDAVAALVGDNHALILGVLHGAWVTVAHATAMPDIFHLAVQSLECETAFHGSGEVPQRITVTGVSFELYEHLLKARGDKPAPRLTYIEGTLQLDDVDETIRDEALSVLVEPPPQSTDVDIQAVITRAKVLATALAPLSSEGRNTVHRLLLAMMIIEDCKLSPTDHAHLEEIDMIDDDTPGAIPEINRLLIFLDNLRSN